MTTRTASPTGPEQLALLTPTADVPLQFRLDQRTRQRGLAHIAVIRRQLANRSASGSQAQRDDRSRAA